MPSTYEKRKEAWDRKRAQAKLEQEQAAALAATPPVVPDPDFPDELPPVPPVEAAPVVVTAVVPAKVEMPVAKKAAKVSVVIGVPAPADGEAHPTVSVTTAFAAWLASPMGYECTDPRAPSDPTRKRVDLEDRLRKAFIAGVMAGMEVVKG